MRRWQWLYPNGGGGGFVMERNTVKTDLTRVPIIGSVQCANLMNSSVSMVLGAFRSPRSATGHRTAMTDRMKSTVDQCLEIIRP